MSITVVYNTPGSFARKVVATPVLILPSHWHHGSSDHDNSQAIMIYIYSVNRLSSIVCVILCAFVEFRLGRAMKSSWVIFIDVANTEYRLLSVWNICSFINHDRKLFPSNICSYFWRTVIAIICSSSFCVTGLMNWPWAFYSQALSMGTSSMWSHNNCMKWDSPTSITKIIPAQR